MAILRCPHCQFLKEVANTHLGKTVPCPKCKKEAKVVDTVKLVETAVNRFLEVGQKYKELKQNSDKTELKLKQLVDKLITLTNEKIALKAQLEELTENNTVTLPAKTDAPTLSTSLFKEFNQKNTTAPKPTEKIVVPEGYVFENQSYAAELNNFQPVVDWFKTRNIQIEPNVQASDVSGYFDEIAVLIGDNLAILDKLLEGIRYRQRKGYDRFKIELKEYAQEEVKFIKRFCQTAYEFAFFSRYQFNKEFNTISLVLNNSPQIQNFFNGDWLEWYVFMKVASFLLANKYPFACLRSSKIVSATTHQQNEIDIFFLINGNLPLWIECKSGEFRDSINKYQELRKKLNINPDYSLLLVSGLENEKVDNFSSMFKIRIMNEKKLLPYLAGLFQAQK